MTPILDPRPFAEVLADWLGRRGLTAYSAAGRLPATEEAIRKWLHGGRVLRSAAIARS